MRSKTIRYFITEGAKSFFVNGLMSLASVIIVVASLLILGIYLLFSMNINFMGEQLKDQYEIRAYIVSGTNDETMRNIGDEIKKISNVKSVEFFTADQAFQECKEQFGDKSHILDGLENDNPFRFSYKVKLNNLTNSQLTADSIGRIDGVDWVKNNKSAMDKILGITSGIKTASFWLMLLLSLVAIFIIANTIKLTVFARRREIGIMKYLGATDWFISWPFVIEGIIIGIIGCLVALIIVIPVYTYCYQSLALFLNGAVRIYTIKELAPSLVSWFAGIGIMLGAFGSAISLRRYLHV